MEPKEVNLVQGRGNKWTKNDSYKEHTALLSWAGDGIVSKNAYFQGSTVLVRRRVELREKWAKPPHELKRHAWF
jgi:hypothetical protein